MSREKSAPFYAVLEELKKLHDGKGDGYEGTNEAYANYHRAGRWAKAVGKHPEQAAALYALIRADEKLERVRNLFEGANPADESVEDTIKDIPVIGAIALILYREGRKSEP